MLVKSFVNFLISHQHQPVHCPFNKDKIMISLLVFNNILVFTTALLAIVVAVKVLI